MRFEKITENKIRITFNLDDLSENNIDFHSFMSNSDETQALFLDMLDRAEKEIGFVTKDYKLMIEALATAEGNFILTVTRSLPEGGKLVSRRICGRKKDTNISNKYAIYCFNTFDDFCNACESFDINFVKAVNLSLKLSRLYLYNQKYYLVLKIKYNNNTITNLHCRIAEFSSYQKYSNIFENRLIEYGNIIIKDKAFNKIKKYFTPEY